MSKKRILELFPSSRQRSLDGRAVSKDGQMYNAARLVLAFVKSAVNRGAVAANYTQALAFLWEGQRVCGVRARDGMSGDEFDIVARLVLNAAGPWADYLALQDPHHFAQHRRGHFFPRRCFLVTAGRAPSMRWRCPLEQDSERWSACGASFVRRSLARLHLDRRVHRLFTRRRIRPKFEESELEAWIAEMNARTGAAPDARRRHLRHCGLVPLETAERRGRAEFRQESRFIDHRAFRGRRLGYPHWNQVHDCPRDAGKALDLLLQQRSGSVRQHRLRIFPGGGDIGDFAAIGGERPACRAGNRVHPTLGAWLRITARSPGACEWRAEPNVAQAPGRIRHGMQR